MSNGFPSDRPNVYLPRTIQYSLAIHSTSLLTLLVNQIDREIVNIFFFVPAYDLQ